MRAFLGWLDRFVKLSAGHKSLRIVKISISISSLMIRVFNHMTLDPNIVIVPFLYFESEDIETLEQLEILLS